MRLVPLMLTAFTAVCQIVRAENELIFAKILNGKTIPIEFEPSNAVERLKEKIKEKEGIPREQQQLIFNGQLLEGEDRRISEYGLVAGSTVTLLIYQRDANAQKILVDDLVSSSTTLVLLEPNMTVASLKSELISLSPINRTQIFFANKLLDDDGKLLTDYNVGAWSTLTATLRYISYLSVRKILVKTPSMKTIAVEIGLDETVASIKAKISAMEGIPIDEQALIFSDKQREDDNDRLDYLDSDRWPLVTLGLRQGPGPKQTICVKTLAQKTMSFKVNLSDTVSSLKASIANETHISPHLQQLVFRGKLLRDDEKQMSDYDITAWSTLTLIVRPVEKPIERVSIKTLANRNIGIDIDLGDTVATLKDKIRQRAQVPQCLQQLVFDGKLLENDEQLAYYGIENKSTVFMVLYLKGRQAVDLIDLM